MLPEGHTGRKSRRKAQCQAPDRLQSLPLELLLIIASHVDLASLLSLSTVSKAMRSLILGESCAALWLLAIEAEGLSELEAPLRPAQYANLVFGKRCQVCDQRVGRKVEYHLRTRLCSKCWDEEIVYEGPDEPDPAFEGFFPGTKRYTPRSPFFFLHMLESTSSYLATLFAPQIAAYEQALESDPLAELDDFFTFSVLPPPLQRELDERSEWVRRCWRDGEKLEAWAAKMKRRKRIKARTARVIGRAGEAAAVPAVDAGSAET
ncbi:hypothetical protein JCM10908_005766 [Rhodotorula pacifica]|uniref:uncharacterized protein n=1 Tax=Rhodotorula pacifica TaxID=1495444 RepID=UPI003182AC2E